MKRLFLIYMLVVIIFIQNISLASEIDITDIDNNWAKEYIQKMVKDGTISGYEDGTFKPNNEISVAEFLKILITQQDYKLVTTGEKWPDWYINTALYNDLIKENEFNEFSNSILRKDAVKILSRYINVDDVEKSKKTFSDLSKENKVATSKLVNLGIISGFQDGTFRENDALTRAQACKMIYESYYIKKDLNINRKFKISNENSNINGYCSGDKFTKTRYEIKNNRIYINDSGNYANLSNMTLNQEYINDSQVIKLIESLADKDSYIAVLYIPDKYTINTLNVCYGQRQGYVYNGMYTFQFRFYENGNYNLAAQTGINEFSDDIYMKIELDKMWEKLSEYESEVRASKNNLDKLEKAFKALFGEKTSTELRIYLEEKLKEVSKIENDEFEAKMKEVKKFGKYTFNILCTRDEKIQIYVKRNK